LILFLSIKFSIRSGVKCFGWFLGGWRLDVVDSVSENKVEMLTCETTTGWNFEIGGVFGWALWDSLPAGVVERAGARGGGEELDADRG